jgi:hypothetical protein
MEIYSHKTLLKSLIQFVEPFKLIINAHNLEFLSKNHWDLLVAYDEDLINQIMEAIDSHGTLIDYMKNMNALTKKYSKSN